MGKVVKNAGAEGLRFFGKTNRLISHELKNVFAIITETLGLMEDLLELSQGGETLNLDRLHSIKQSIIDEVGRANSVVRCLNTVAHCVDELVGPVDVAEIISLAVEITKFNPVLRNTAIRFVKTEPQVIYSSRFFLVNLFYHILDFAISAMGPEGVIHIVSDVEDKKIRVSFSGVDGTQLKSFSTTNASRLIKIVGAKTAVNIPDGKLEVLLPINPPKGGLLFPVFPVFKPF
ncbi:MAG: HAMP domain-containing histidine kinase [Deltaproteobacteria bacterium]|nr:HAMP domain-containing histidine kinase [Deltaproteobacteria bacterium]